MGTKKTNILRKLVDVLIDAVYKLLFILVDSYSLNPKIGKQRSMKISTSCYFPCWRKYIYYKPEISHILYHVSSFVFGKDIFIYKWRKESIIHLFALSY